MDRKAPQVSSAGPLLCSRRRLWCPKPRSPNTDVCHGPRVDGRGFTLTAVTHQTLTASAPGKGGHAWAGTSRCGWGCGRRTWAGEERTRPLKPRQPLNTKHLHPKLLSVQTTVPQGSLPWDSGCRKRESVWKPHGLHVMRLWSSTGEEQGALQGSSLREAPVSTGARASEMLDPRARLTFINSLQASVFSKQ